MGSVTRDDGARAPARTSRLRARLAGRAGPLDRIRRALFVFAVANLVILLVPAAILAPLRPAAIVLAATAVLAASWTHGYLTGRTCLAAELVDAAALAAYVVGTSAPEQVLPIAFASVWFRCFDGTDGRAVVRWILTCAGLGVGLALWDSLPKAGALEPADLLFSLPLLGVTVLLVRLLHAGVSGMVQAARRDAALAVGGGRLVGTATVAEAYTYAWEVSDELCAATPGLRILVADAIGGEVAVRGSSGPFRQVPATIDVGVLVDDPEPGTVRDGRALDAAAGEPCTWRWLPLPDPTTPGWMVLGGPPEAVRDAVDSARLLVTQVVLAIRGIRTREALGRRASTDPLTGLANRSAMEAAVAAHLAAGTGDAAGVSLVYLDLDDFKRVNDAFGHGTGDDVLREVAARLRAGTRAVDVCAHLGSDEFVVLLPGAPADAAAELVRALLCRLAAPLAVGDHELTVAVSAGLSHALPGGATFEELLHEADIAMYAAKAQGKNRLQVFDAALLESPEDSVFARQLAAAAGRGELTVHYQPVVDLVTGRCSAVEALVRWQHPQRGLLLPGSFIAEAERCGAILDIGAWVLRTACTDVAAWRRAGHPLVLHVNVSVAQLLDDRLLELVDAVLRRTALPPGDLVVEITESMVLDNPAVLARLHRLADVGVRVAVDDFGTGYASLTSLRELPVAVVKIDRSFVAGAESNPVDLAALEAIIQMTQRLGLTTIAEGVEELDQHVRLTAAGAQYGQGFLYARPASADDTLRWLQGRGTASGGWLPRQQGEPASQAAAAPVATAAVD